MGNANSNILPIEYFLWTKENNPTDKLVYYDQEGTCFEKDINGALIDDALKIFDGRKRAVARKSGGLILAEPYQIVLLEDEHGGRAKVRIRVRFTDFKLDKRGTVNEAEYITHTKIVDPKDLLAPFTMSQNEQTFVLDFGQGIVPVHVFHMETDEAGISTAYFADTEEAEHLLRLRVGEKTELRLFQVNQEALRHASEAEMKQARENLDRLKRLGGEVIPTCLAFAAPVAVPAAASLADVRHFLRVHVDRLLMGEGWEPLYIAIRREDGEELLPFGSLE